MKTTMLLLGMACAISTHAQITVNFDDNSKWTAGSGALSTYQTNHVYEDGLFIATGGDAMRNGNGEQDGFPAALGEYSWRLRNTNNVDWRITITSGGINSFSVAVRRWDGTPSPNFSMEYSLDTGTTWTKIATINNTTLGDSSDWFVYEGTIKSAAENIQIRFISNGTTERIMIDNFIWTPQNLSLENVSTQSFSMYPNPNSTGNLFFETKSAAPVKIIVFDVLGSKLFSELVHIPQLDISSLNKGMYILKITQENTSFTKKLIVK